MKRLRGLAGALILAVFVLVGLTHTVTGAHRARQFIATQDRKARSGGQLEIFPGVQARFIVFIKSVVPEHARVRIVYGVAVAARAGGVQGQSCTTATRGALDWWLVYAIAPRASVCNRDTEWTIYVGIAPPPGGTMYRMTPEYAVVRR